MPLVFKELTSFTRNLWIPKTLLLHGAGAQISWMVETHKPLRITGACQSREKTCGSACWTLSLIIRNKFKHLFFRHQHTLKYNSCHYIKSISQASKTFKLLNFFLTRKNDAPLMTQVKPEMGPYHKNLLHESPPMYKHTSEILWVWFQTMAIKQLSQQNKSNKFSGFSANI